MNEKSEMPCASGKEALCTLWRSNLICSGNHFALPQFAQGSKSDTLIRVLCVVDGEERKASNGTSNWHFIHHALSQKIFPCAHHHVCQKMLVSQIYASVKQNIIDVMCGNTSCLNFAWAKKKKKDIMSAVFQLPPAIQSHASDLKLSCRDTIWSLCVGRVTKQRRVQGVSHIQPNVS